MEESENQELANPEVKEKQNLINQIKKRLNKLYKEVAKARENLNKDGKPRKNSKKEELKTMIQEEETKLNTANEQKRRLPEKVDASSLENYKSFKKIDNEGKNLFDLVTSSVWNARKQMVDLLRPFFNRQNELVDLFYTITECRGWIKSTKTEVIVRLGPLQQPRRRSAQIQFWRKLTSLGAQTPTGKWLVIEVGDSPLD